MMTINELFRVLDKAIKNGQGNDTITVQKKDKSDFLTLPDWQLDVELSFYDDGIVIVFPNEQTIYKFVCMEAAFIALESVGDKIVKQKNLTLKEKQPVRIYTSVESFW